MSAVKIMTISLPVPMGRTRNELLRESLRQYDARRQFRKLALTGQQNAKRLGLTREDFGGPFED